MVTRIPVPQPTLRRSIEQILAASPQGLPWRALTEELGRRAAVTGRPAEPAHEVVRQLGGLLVDGRVDERNGRFVLQTVPVHRRIPGAVHDRAA